MVSRGGQIHDEDCLGLGSQLGRAMTAVPGEVQHHELFPDLLLHQPHWCAESTEAHSSGHHLKFMGRGSFF